MDAFDYVGDAPASGLPGEGGRDLKGGGASRRRSYHPAAYPIRWRGDTAAAIVPVPAS